MQRIRYYEFYTDLRNSQKRIASIAELLPAANHAGDSSAIKIATQIIDQLIDLTHPVIKKIPLEQESVAMCGGIFQHDKYITNAYRKKTNDLYPDISCVYPKNNASY